MNADGQIYLRSGTFANPSGISRSFKNISTTISQGEVVVIVGPSGSGKSTFLRSLNLLEEPTAGQIPFLRERISPIPKANINLYRQHIGMVFQHFNLFSPQDDSAEHDACAHPAAETSEKRKLSRRPCSFWIGSV